MELHPNSTLANWDMDFQIDDRIVFVENEILVNLEGLRPHLSAFNPENGGICLFFTLQQCTTESEIKPLSETISSKLSEKFESHAVYMAVLENGKKIAVKFEKIA